MVNGVRLECQLESQAAMAVGEPTVAGGKDGREEDGVRDAKSDARYSQLPLGRDKHQGHLADGQHGETGKDHGLVAEALRQTSDEDPGDDGRDGVDGEEHADSGNGEFHHHGP